MGKNGIGLRGTSKAVVAGIAGCLLLLVLLFDGSGCTQPERTESTAAQAGPKPLAVETGALEGTYLKVLWTYQHGGALRGLYYGDGVVLLETGDGYLMRLNELNGLPYDNSLKLRSPLAFAPAVYRYTAQAQKSDEIYVVQEGDVLWCVEADSLLELWAENLDYGVACTPLVSSDMVFICAEGGRINGVRKKDRSEIWSFSARDTISSPPVLEDTGGVIRTQKKGEKTVLQGGSESNFLYAASEDGSVYRLNVYIGWKPPGGAGGYSWEGKTKARIVTSPVSYQERVFAASLDFSVYAFENVDGAVAWKYQVGRYVRDPLFACRNTVFVLAEDVDGGPKIMYALDTRTGACRWKRRVKGAGGAMYHEDGLPGVAAFLAPGRDVVYLLAEEKPEIWAVRVEDGTVLHRIPLTRKPDFIVSHDAQHGRLESAYGLILLGTKDGRVVCLKERRVY